jgi:hypothetical protein
MKKREKLIFRLYRISQNDDKLIKKAEKRWWGICVLSHADAVRKIENTVFKNWIK